MKLNLKQHENEEAGGYGDKEFEPIPDGEKLQARISEVTLETSKANNKYFKVEILITEDGPYKGRKLWDNFMTSESSLWKIAKLLRCLGVPLSDDMEVVPATFKGKALRVTVGQEEYNDKIKNIVKYFDPPAGGVRQVAAAATGGASRFNV
jgi:hypothetical protein